MWKSKSGSLGDLRQRKAKQKFNKYWKSITLSARQHHDCEIISMFFSLCQLKYVCDLLKYLICQNSFLAKEESYFNVVQVLHALCFEQPEFEVLDVNQLCIQ